MTLFKRVLANSSWALIGEGLAKGLFLLVTFWLARALGVSNYGTFNLAQTVAFQTWLISELGVNMYGSREIARNKEAAAALAGPLFTLRILGAAAALILLLGVVTALPLGDAKTVFYASSLYLLTRTLHTDWVLRGLEKFRDIAEGNFATFLTMLALTLLLVGSPDDVATASLIWSFSYLVGGIYLLWAIYRKYGLRVRFGAGLATLRSHLRESIHFTLANSLFNLYLGLPVLYLGIFASQRELGLFSAPYRLVLSLLFVFSILARSIYPILSDLHSSNRVAFQKLHRIYGLAVFVLGLGLAVGITLLSERAILFLYGPAYRESAPVLRVLIWFAFLSAAFRQVYEIALSASRLQRFYPIAGAAGVVLFSAGFALMRVFGGLAAVDGAALCLLGTEVGIAGVLLLIWKLKNDAADSVARADQITP